MFFCRVEVRELLALLPENILSELASETHVDHYSKKLQGELVFKLLLHCILSHKDNSLRTMESAYESIGFGLLKARAGAQSIHYSSISERLSVIDPVYFERLYNVCLEKYSGLFKQSGQAILRFDSTIIALSGKLLKTGYQIKGGDAEYLRQLKFTIGYADLPVAVHFFTEQKYTSENVALKEAVLAYNPDNPAVIRIFDKGITSRRSYDEFTNKGIPFISRINERSKQQPLTDNKLEDPVETATLNILSDRSVFLFMEGHLKAMQPLRCIEAIKKETNERITFITNMEDLPAQDITMLYKRRWDIEVFFKFLKQELNFSHLINRSENGIRVMLYCTMIAAILLLTYKEVNGLKGYKIMRQKFVNELEKLLMKDIVLLCGGNPELVDRLLKYPPV